jgi:class 3 adenylate cyclase
VTCPSCHEENPAGARFCNNCGTRLAEACSSCGAARVGTGKFCSECGTAFAPNADASSAPQPAANISIAPPTAAPVAERRLVSILFADLVGFTPFAEERDAEEVRETLSRYFDLAAEVIKRYGGTVEKFIGDAVMAVWGAPVAQEDDAERTVRAALELVEVVRRLGPGIQARAGVLTGEAAVTIGATNQGMVAGDLVNVAARLQSVADPGTVLVGEATMHAASAAIAFEPIGDRDLKGKSAPVAAWQAIRVVAERGGRGRSDAIEAPFVGRTDELHMMKELLHATGREGRSRLVSIMGPAGIGKSRLAWEFLKYVDGVTEDVWWHNGRSPAYGEGIAFWALGEMIRSRAGLTADADEATTREQIAATVRAHVPDEGERRWIEPALLALLGIGAEAQSSEQLFAAWRTFFERMAQTGTLALVFEDLHWADPGTLDFIEHVLEWGRSSPIIIVTLARPELLERRPDWGAAKRNFSSLYLDPLTEAEMRELLNGLVPGLPPTAVNAIVARADGIPLYAVETVRTLIAQGRIGLEDGRYVPTGDLSAIAVPESLHALIAARLDALPSEERTLVGHAAVLGQSFTVAGLAAVAGEEASVLEPVAQELVRRELFVQNRDPRSPEKGQYAFVQALIREVAYGGIARRDRKSRHLAAARHFESLDSQEMAGPLAVHYLSAHENATEGPEADAIAAQARIALKAAADRATALGGHVQAVTYLKQALPLVTDSTEEAELVEAAVAGGGEPLELAENPLPGRSRDEHGVLAHEPLRLWVEAKAELVLEPHCAHEPERIVGEDRCLDGAQRARLEVGSAAVGIDVLAAADGHGDRVDGEVARGQVVLDRGPEEREVDGAAVLERDPPGAPAVREGERGAAARAGVGARGGLGVAAGDVEVDDGPTEELVPDRAADDPRLLPAEDLLDQLTHRRSPFGPVRGRC